MLNDKLLRLPRHEIDANFSGIGTFALLDYSSLV